MKKVLIAIFAITITLMLAFRFGYSEAPNLTGKWHTETETSSFDLNLVQSNNSLSGSHCSVQMNGSKVDCVLEDSDISLTGNVGDSLSVIVTFTSQLSMKDGTARIRQINENTIEWKMLNKPQGEFQLPKEAILTKQIVLTPDKLD